MIEVLRQHWLAFFVGLTTVAFTALMRLLWGRVKREVKEQATLKSGVLALLHDRVYQACQYYIHAGSISLDDLKNLEHLFKGYHDLGGNGTCEELYGRVRKLAIKRMD